MKNIKYNVLDIVLIIYLILSFLVTKIISNNIFYLVINPLFWVIISIYIYAKTNNIHGRFSNLKENMKTLFIFTLFYIIIYFLSGLIFTYARSPYSHSIDKIIINFIQIIVPVIGIEYVRSYLINENKKNILMIIFFTLLFIIFELNFAGALISDRTRESTFMYISSTILPVLFSNILYSYLTLKGSYKLVLTYRLPYELALILAPIFPNFDWFMQGVFGILVPVIIYIVLKYYINFRTEKRKTRKRNNPILYVPIIFIITIFVMFMIGMFEYEPIAILTNSMNPIFYRGDVVIYRKVDDKKLKNLDLYTIIVYSKEDQVVVHRVVNKYYKKGDLYFITKGDANISNDSDPVSTEDIMGVYEFSIKSIGKPSVWLHDYFKNEKAKVEIK